MININEKTSKSLRKNEAVHCFSNLKLLNQSINDILKTDFSEKMQIILYWRINPTNILYIY